MGIIQLIGVFLFSSMAAIAIESFQRSRQKQGGPAPFQAPVVPAGARIPVVFGTWRVRPVCTWFGGAKTYEVKTFDQPLLLGFIHFASIQEIKSGYEYGVTGQFLLCWGPAVVRNIIFGDSKPLTSQTATQRVSDPGGTAWVDVATVDNAPLSSAFYNPFFGGLDLQIYHGGVGAQQIFLPNVYGGPGRGGGVKGIMRFGMGSRQYGPDALMVEKLGAANVPSYADFATLVYDDLIMGESPVPPPIDYIMRGQGYPVNSRMVGPTGKQWLVEDTAGSEILRIALTHPWFGQAEPLWKLDLGNFDSVLDTLVTEGLGMSLYAGGSSGPTIDTFQNLREECEKFMGGVLRHNAETFQWEIKLLRDETAAFSTLPLYDERQIASLEWTKAEPTEVTNSVTVEYSDAEQLYQTNTVTLKNDANIAMTRETRPATVQYLSCTDRETAWRLCARELRERSTPLGRGQAKASRALWSALPGDVIRLSNARHRLDQLMVRVLSVDLGTPEDAEITVTFVEDVFAHPTIPRQEDPAAPQLASQTIIRPAITAMKTSVGSGVGTLEFTVLDPEHRITSVAAATKSGAAALSAYTNLATAAADTSDPTFPFNAAVTSGDMNTTFTVTVALNALAESAIAVRLRYIGYSSVGDPLSDIQEVNATAYFPLLRRTGVPVLGFAYSGTDVIVTASAPDATRVKIAAAIGTVPDLTTVRAATAIVAPAAFTATFPAPAVGEVLYVEALAYESTDESSLSAPLTISGGAPSGSVGGASIIVRDGSGGFEFVFVKSGASVVV